MERREIFTSRWALILAALGMAIGTGNIWRFPRVVAQNGGAAFLIPWIIFLFLWSIPLLIAELAIGKHTRRSPIGAFGTLIGKKYTWMGGFVGFCTMAIMFYYSVVMGWCVKYFVSSSFGNLINTNALVYWDTFTKGYSPILFHFVAISVGIFVIYKGIIKGIEKANKILIPALFIIFIIIAIRALTLPNSVDGLNFFFHPDWKLLLDYKVWLQALTQSAWSTGAGWGLLLTYAIYTRQDEDIVLNSVITGFGNNSASLLAGIVIFPAVFALAPQLGLNPAQVVTETGPANTGLTFIWLPELFSKLPLGNIFMPFLFLALSFAALSSLIAMIEMSTRIFMDLGLTRKNSILLVWILGFFLGVPSAVSIGFFNNQDWVWGIGLMVSGCFFAIAIIKFGVTDFRMQLINTSGSDFKIGRWYDYIITYLIPLEFIVLVIWWFWQSIQWYPETWWNPFKEFTLGTCLFQWTIMIVVLVILNQKISTKILSREIS